MFPLFLFFYLFFRCSDGIEREACVCDHRLERSDLCAEIIIIIIIIIQEPSESEHTTTTVHRRPGRFYRQEEANTCTVVL